MVWAMEVKYDNSHRIHRIRRQLGMGGAGKSCIAMHNCQGNEATDATRLQKTTAHLRQMVVAKQVCAVCAMLIGMGYAVFDGTDIHNRYRPAFDA